jgi:hypothetical protein
MSYHEKYINPFTDFGFKKIFGDPNDTSLLKSLNQLQDIPNVLRGDIIEKVFERAEFIKLPKVEQNKYHKNLKVYRDLLNSFDTAFNQGIQKGLEKGVQQEKIDSAKRLFQSGIESDFISKITGLHLTEINELIDELKKNTTNRSRR